MRRASRFCEITPAPSPGCGNSSFSYRLNSDVPIAAPDMPWLQAWSPSIPVATTTSLKLRPTARTPTPGGAVGGLRLEDARAHRERADALARAGRYTEALAHRFVAVVLDLDARQAIKFHPSKTPAEYVGEARLDPSGRASLADLVGRLYRHVFGAVPCDERAYHEFAAEAELVFEHVAAA